MTFVTVTLTSASTGSFSTPVGLSWRSGKPTTVSIFPSSATTSAAWTLQYTLDDVTLIPAGSSFVTWLNYVASAIGVPGVVYNATTAGTDGSLFPLLSPFAGVRMQSTGVTGGTLTMKVIQPDGF